MILLVMNKFVTFLAGYTMTFQSHK